VGGETAKSGHTTRSSVPFVLWIVKVVAAGRTQVPDLSGEPPGTRTQGPRLKSGIDGF